MQSEAHDQFSKVSEFTITIIIPGIEFLISLPQQCVAVRLEQDEKAQMRHKYALAKVKLERVSLISCGQLACWLSTG